MQDAAAAAAPETPTAEVDTALSVIGSGIEALADIAPGLTGAELKVLLEVARRQMCGKKAVRLSSRELANACKLGRSNVVMALDTLTAKGQSPHAKAL